MYAREGLELIVTKHNISWILCTGAYTVFWKGDEISSGGGLTNFKIKLYNAWEAINPLRGSVGGITPFSPAPVYAYAHVSIIFFL